MSAVDFTDFGAVPTTVVGGETQHDVTVAINRAIDTAPGISGVGIAKWASACSIAYNTFEDVHTPVDDAPAPGGHVTNVFYANKFAKEIDLFLSGGIQWSKLPKHPLDPE